MKKIFGSLLVLAMVLSATVGFACTGWNCGNVNGQYVVNTYQPFAGSYDYSGSYCHPGNDFAGTSGSASVYAANINSANGKFAAQAGFANGNAQLNSCVYAWDNGYDSHARAFAITTAEGTAGWWSFPSRQGHNFTVFHRRFRHRLPDQLR
jgi:hypothetical protein